jgi:hypothetical protein
VWVSFDGDLLIQASSVSSGFIDDKPVFQPGRAQYRSLWLEFVTGGRFPLVDSDLPFVSFRGNFRSAQPPHAMVTRGDTKIWRMVRALVDE